MAVLFTSLSFSSLSCSRFVLLYIFLLWFITPFHTFIEQGRQDRFFISVQSVSMLKLLHCASSGPV